MNKLKLLKDFLNGLTIALILAFLVITGGFLIAMIWFFLVVHFLSSNYELRIKGFTWVDSFDSDQKGSKVISIISFFFLFFSLYFFSKVKFKLEDILN